MKKIVQVFLGLMLAGAFSSVLAGTMGYVWVLSRSHYYDDFSYANYELNYVLRADHKKGLPDVNSIIRIEPKNKLFIGFDFIQNITNDFMSLVKNGKCEDLRGAFSYFMLNGDNECSLDSVVKKVQIEYPHKNIFEIKNPIKAKVLGYVEFQAGVFVLIEQLEVIKEK